MQPFYTDIIILLLIILSAVVGFIRGFVTEVFTIIGWIAAIIATLYLTPVFKGFTRGLMESQTIADLVTASVIFIITLVLFSVVSYFGSKSLRESKLNAVDRSLGFGFGLFRALLLLGLAYILVSWVWAPPKRPTWITEAKTHHVMVSSAVMIKNILPGDLDIQIRTGDDAPSALDRVMEGKPDMDINIKKPEDQTGYTDEDRDILNDFFGDDDNDE